jgi:hypothetical protein
MLIKGDYDEILLKWELVGKTSEIVMTSLSLSLSLLEGFLSLLSKLLRKGCVCVCVCVWDMMMMMMMMMMSGDTQAKGGWG